MSDPARSAPYLHDALLHLLAEPEQASLWSGFAQSLLDCADDDLRSRYFVTAIEKMPRTGMPGFFRAMLALQADQETDNLPAVVREIAQGNGEAALTRQCAVLTFLWTLAMNRCSTRRAYRQKLIGAAAHELAAGIQASVARNSSDLPFLRTVGRVAIVLVDASTARHPPTRLALDHAGWLAQAGCTVHIFSACESHCYQPAATLGLGRPWQETPPPAADLADWGRHLSRGGSPVPDISVTLADRMRAPGARYRPLLARLAEFAPDCVVQIGYTSGMGRVLYTHYPVVSISTLSVPALAPADIWLSPAYPVPEGDVSWHPALPIGQVLPRTLRLLDDPGALPGSRDAVRQQLGLLPGQIVILSAGGRLDNEIPKDWLVHWKSFLEAHPHVCWLLVGSTKTIPALQTLPSAQVRQLPWVDELQILTAAVDLYANPPRLGGGTSVLMALAAGVPVVSYADCDGGDKIGAHAVTDDAAYFALLRRLASEPQWRAEYGAAMRRLFAGRPDASQSARTFIDACDLARQRFQARQGQPMPALHA